MSTSPVIIIDKLTKYYGRTRGIENLSLSLTQGEVLGFLGPNGAGKTTTIRLLLGLLKPSAGSVSIFGEKVTANSIDIRRRCGYLPGNFTAYEYLSGEAFLRLSARLRAVMPSWQPELLRRFKLTPENLTRRIKHLSHGTRQKLGIVQAFFHQPELLILDEPTLGLDPLMQDEFYALLKDFQQQGISVLLSSHNLAEVEKVCQRVAIIRNGELIALEKITDLKNKCFRHLKMVLERPVSELDLPDAQLIRQQDLHYEFLVRGATLTFLQKLAQLPIRDFAFPEPNLDDVFMTYYRENTND